MLKWIIRILIEEIVGAVVKAVSDYRKLKKKTKINKDTAKGIMLEKDPVKRAARMHDFLNS